VNLNIVTEFDFEKQLFTDSSGLPVTSWSENKKALYNRWVCEKRKSKAEQSEQIKESARENFRKFGGKR